MEGDEAIQSKSQNTHGKRIKITYSDTLYHVFTAPLWETNKSGSSSDHVWEKWGDNLWVQSKHAIVDYDHIVRFWLPLK